MGMRFKMPGAILSVATMIGCGGGSANDTTYVGSGSTPGSPNAGVVLSKNEPTSSTCHSVGIVVGHGGGMWGGYIANDTLITMAMEDLQEKAAKMGANYVSYDSPSLGQAGEGTTTTATVNGMAYKCPDGPNAKAAAVETASAEPPVAVTVPQKEEQGEGSEPDGVAGFRFAMTREEAEAACTEAGHQWSSSETSASCSGTVKPVGFDGSVHLQPCSEQFCKVLVMAELDESTVVEKVMSLQEALTKTYGEPARKSGKVPEECQDQVNSCVLSGKAYFLFMWEFETGEKITLRLGKKGGSTANDLDSKLRLYYSVPEAEPELDL